MSIPWDEVIIALLAVVAIAIAYAVGVFRANSILGPSRLSDDVALWPLLVVAGIGGMAWLGSQFGYTVVIAAKYMMSHGGERFTADMLSGGDLAFLSTLPGIFGFAILLLGDWFIPRRILDRLGLTWGKLPRGILRGLLAALIVLPLVYGSSVVMELIYRAIKFEHPNEHDLLRAMRGMPSLMKAALIVGATVVAPVFEEYFFRGHLQTIFVRMFNGRGVRTPPPLPSAFPVIPAVAVEAGSASSEYLRHGVGEESGMLAMEPPIAVEPVAPADSPRTPFRVWLAVIITSIIFAGVHAAWTAPIIFVLSLCLGYVYERTGNLWTNIIIHAAFNTVSTVVFLNYVQ